VVSNGVTTKKEKLRHSTQTPFSARSVVFPKQKHVTSAKRNVHANQHGIATCQKKHWLGHRNECIRLRAEIKQKKKTAQSTLDKSQTDVDGGTSNAAEVKEDTHDEDGKEKMTTSTQETEKTKQEEEEEGDECCICLEKVSNDATKFVRWTCCGQGMHVHCTTDLQSMKMAGTCPLCRALTPTSDEEAVKQLRPWVKKKKGWAQYLMGQMYCDGLGVKQSYEMAARLYEQAAQQGDVSSMYNLGVLYALGKGVEQSYERAKEYYEPAAHLGHAKAQYTLGNLYYAGQGVTQSYEKAFEYFEQSAHLGYEEGQFNLGGINANGQGVGRDLEKAKEWWTKASAQGHEHAIQNLKM